MKKSLLSLIAAALVFCGCSNKSAETATLTLNLDNADGQTVYLCWTADDGNEMIDSAVITESKAVMAIPHGDPQTLYTIKYDKGAQCGVFTFFTENQNTTITGNYNDMPHWSVEGCQTMNELSAHHKKSAELYEDRIMAIYTEMSGSDHQRIEELNTEVQGLIKEYLDYQVAFIRSHSDSYIGHYMLDLMKESLDFSLVSELAAGLTNESTFSRSVKEYVANRPKAE